MDPGKLFEKTPEGIEALTWVLYIASGILALATLGEISGTLLLIGCLAIIFLARSRKDVASGTIHASHLARISFVMTTTLIVALVLLAVTWVTFGIGILITWPLYVIYLCWLAYMLIRGLMKLNDGQAV